MPRSRDRLRVLIDTNVLVSAEIVGGRPGRILELALIGEISLYLSKTTINEFARVMSEKIGIDDDRLTALLKLLIRSAEIVEADKVDEIVKGQAGDNAILAAAIAGEVDYLVTGDHKHLVPLKKIGRIPIITPERLLQILAER